MLGECGADFDAVLAQIVVQHLPAFEALERMSTLARVQRNRTVTEIRREREAAAAVEALRRTDVTSVEVVPAQGASRRERLAGTND